MDHLVACRRGRLVALIFGITSRSPAPDRNGRRLRGGIHSKNQGRFRQPRQPQAGGGCNRKASKPDPLVGLVILEFVAVDLREHRTAFGRDLGGGLCLVRSPDVFGSKHSWASLWPKDYLDRVGFEAPKAHVSLDVYRFRPFLRGPSPCSARFHLHGD